MCLFIIGLAECGSSIEERHKAQKASYLKEGNHYSNTTLGVYVVSISITSFDALKNNAPIYWDRKYQNLLQETNFKIKTFHLKQSPLIIKVNFVLKNMKGLLFCQLEFQPERSYQKVSLFILQISP